MFKQVADPGNNEGLLHEAVQEIGVKANVWWQVWHAQVCFTSNDHTKHRQAASSSHAKFKLDYNPAWRPG